MTQAAITVNNISKCYKLGEIATIGEGWNLFGKSKSSDAQEACADSNNMDRPSETTLPNPHSPNSSRTTDEDQKILWALKNISFEVPRGQVTGIIGRNGAGKSTLLKILSRITDPTEGSAIIRGRVGSLLEIGTGFHPELTGRENIFLNGSILGMSRREIEQRYDDIVDFSEIGRFIDTPVKRYSSGMFTRLAFAVAANLDPEILIIDEVLSVGDAAFQKKCLSKINSLMRSGRTVIFVSHSMSSVSELCQSAILLHKGEMLKAGPILDVIGAYTDLLSEGSLGEVSLNTQKNNVSILEVSLKNGLGNQASVFDLSDTVEIAIKYELFKEFHAIQTCLTLSRNMTEIINTFDTDEDEDRIPVREPGVYVAKHKFPAYFLKAGSYSVRVSVGTITLNLIDIDGVIQFSIEELSRNTQYLGYKKERLGHIISPGHWEVEKLR